MKSLIYTQFPPAYLNNAEVADDILTKKMFSDAKV